MRKDNFIETRMQKHCSHITVMFLFLNKQSSHTHTRANAHTCNSNLFTSPLEFSQQRRDLSCAGDAKGVSECNCTTFGIQFLHWNLQGLRSQEQ